MKNISTLVGASSDKGPTRPANEDAYWVSDERTPVEFGALFLVADGVGGQEYGAAAAQLSVQVVSAAYYQLRQRGLDIPAALNDAILQGNEAVYKQAQARNISKMGCTFVAAVQHEQKLYVAHVGDARAYLLLENRLRPLTRDDTWVQKQVDAGVITAEEAERHELRNVVTQVLGNKLDIIVHQSDVQDLFAGDIFLLCSDGLHGVLSNEQIYKLMKYNQPQAAADALIEAAIAAHTSDNVTAVVVDSGVKIVRKGKLRPKGKPNNGWSALPLWARATIVTAAWLFFVFLLYSFWPSGNGGTPLDPGKDELNTDKPVVTDTAVLPTREPTQPPATDPPTLTVEIQPPTVTPTETLLPPTLTPSIDTFDPPLGCVISEGQVFVWRDDQVFSDSCNHIAQAGRVLSADDTVRILNSTSLEVNGPDQACEKNQFIKIQSVAQPAIEGWVLEFSIQPIQSGENCQP